jgi:hypothetical protein
MYSTSRRRYFAASSWKSFALGSLKEQERVLVKYFLLTSHTYKGVNREDVGKRVSV